MDVKREYWMRVTVTAAMIVAVAAKVAGTQHSNLHINQTLVTDANIVEKEFVTAINQTEEKSITLYANHTEVTDISLSEGESVSITFIADPPPPHTITYFLIEASEVLFHIITVKLTGKIRSPLKKFLGQYIKRSITIKLFLV